MCIVSGVVGVIVDLTPLNTIYNAANFLSVRGSAQIHVRGEASMSKKRPADSKDIQQNSKEDCPEKEDQNRIHLTGRVTNDREEGLAEARVEILETGQRAFADQNGDYSLADLPKEEYTIRVIATGFRAQKQRLQISEKTKDLNIILVTQ